MIYPRGGLACAPRHLPGDALLAVAGPFIQQEREMTQPKHANIYAALAAAQMEMGPALKQALNPAFKSRYADLASVMDACLPALNKHGIAVVQPYAEIDGQRAVKTILAHEGGETLESVVPLIIGKQDMQGLGSAMTYARRYGLMGMAGIAPEDDDGNAAAKAAPSGTLTAEQVAEIKTLIDETASDPAAFAKAVRAASIEAIPAADFERARGMLIKKRDKMRAEEAAARAEHEAQRQEEAA